VDKLFYYNLIAKSLIKEFGLEGVEVHFRDLYRGHSRPSGYISIPLWTLERGKVYVIYYIVHELTHIILYRRGQNWNHTPEFKAEEKQVLAKFNIDIVYARAYPKILKQNGSIVYKKYSYTKE
jgi:hypothetical protein